MFSKGLRDSDIFFEGGPDMFGDAQTTQAQALSSTAAGFGRGRLPTEHAVVVLAEGMHGEAATIAYAIDTNASAITDERKAMQPCSSRFPHIQLAAPSTCCRSKPSSIG